MAVVEQMKTKIREILSEKYQKLTPVAACNPEEVEENHFMLAEHAKGVAEVCQKKMLCVSFREAGEATLKRIREGNPCKGHDIKYKTIKRLPGNQKWTYDYSKEDELQKLAGLVGKPEPDESRCLVWVCRPGEFVLVDEVLKLTDLTSFYTGDYDMHDLFRFNGGRYTRIVAGAMDENSAVDTLIYHMLQYDTSGRREKVEEIGGKERYWTSPYSPIRHGAQTSFMCYLHSIAGKGELKSKLGRILDEIKQSEKFNSTQKRKLCIPWEESVMKISAPICMFDAEGRIYILKNPAEVYWYYKTYGMLDYIPFYYFFNELREVKDPKIDWNKYAQAIIQYLLNFCGIDYDLSDIKKQ